ncbi:MAG: hypothetical protein PVH87_07445 [Desulfobacteraceae bacterium]|jgi:hypothetical protein
MKKSMIVFMTLSVLVVAMVCIALAQDFDASMKADKAIKCRQFAELEDVAIILEVNETDLDAEIVLAINSDDGIRRLSVWDPRKRRVLDLKTRDRGRIGLSEVIIETAEPDIESVLNAYPEGEYAILVKTVFGDRLMGTAELRHDLLPAPSFSPSKGDLVDPDADLVVTWDPVPEAKSYTIEIEQDDLDVNITTKLDGTATTFRVPAGFLVPGTEYEIGIATEAPNGNLSVAEGTFQTIE